MATETTKITRMQQRRGLKQDLPKPLRPGEIGFATDSRQIYIGADTVDPVSDIYNKTGVFEKTSSAQSTTASFANVQIIKFTVPHKIYDKGEFDGVTDTISWTPASDVASSSSPTEYSRLGRVFRVGDTEYKNILTGNVFLPSDVTVVKDGVTLLPSQVASIASGNDYYFSQTGNLSVDTHTHELSFRTSPSGSESIAISYYSNTAIINAISNATIGTTGVNGFYEEKNISTYRQLSNNNIRVTPGTGVGFIGMQFKHIQVATDVKETPSAPTVSNLGNLYLTRNDTSDSNITVTYNGSNLLSLTGSITSGSYNTAGVYNHVYVEGADDWLEGKVLLVDDYDSANSTLVAVLPSNAASLTRVITNISDNSGNIQIVSGTSDTAVGDSVFFVDSSGTNDSNLHAVEANITNISTTNEITLDLPYVNYDEANANVSLLDIIVFKNSDPTRVVVNSERHGIPNGNTVNFSAVSEGNSDLDTANTFVVTSTGNVNTFIVTTSTTGCQGNADGLTFTPIVSNTTISATPVLSVDLSSATNVAGAKTTVNELNLWPRLNSVPGENTLYITHAESVVKNPFDFKLHNDSLNTLGQLGLTDGEYTRQNATVKAKLEDWIASIYTNPARSDVNLFKEVYVNTAFSTPFTTWDLNIDSALGEMNFESRAEAKDFTTVVNNLYFESVNPDIRGLLNIKTNIEFLTTEALAAGTATTSFTAPEQITIPAGLGNIPISELSLNLAGDYQTVFVEYSMSGAAGGDNYRRVGTLMYTGDTTLDDAVINDNYSELVSGSLSGNVVFDVNVSSGDLTITTNNTISPSMDLSMQYIVRRWGD